MNILNRELQQNLEDGVSHNMVSKVNVNDVISTLNTNFKDILTNIQKGNEIDILNLNNKFDEIRSKVVEYNKTMEDWYDEQYYKDLSSFNKQLDIFNEKINLYENFSCIGFS